MATKIAKRRHTSLVVNPAPRGLTVRKTAARKANPTARTASAINNPPRRRKSTKRRRRNPSTSYGSRLMSNPGGGVLVGALTAGVGFAFVDMLLARIVPSGTPTIQVAAKVAAGFALQQFGGKIPLLGKYKDGVAFVLYALAAKQLADVYLIPTVRSTFTSITSQAGQFLNPAVVAPATSMAGYNRYLR